MGLAQSVSLRILTSPSLGLLQDVSGPCSVGSLHVLTNPSVCCLQNVSDPHCVSLFSLSNKSLLLPSAESGWAFFSQFLSVF